MDSLPPLALTVTTASSRGITSTSGVQRDRMRLLTPIQKRRMRWRKISERRERSSDTSFRLSGLFVTEERTMRGFFAATSTTSRLSTLSEPQEISG